MEDDYVRAKLNRLKTLIMDLQRQHDESSKEETCDVTHAHCLLSDRRILRSTLLRYLKLYEKQCIVCNVAKSTKVGELTMEAFDLRSV